MDRGESRSEEFKSPRMVGGFLKSWPSYSLTRQASKAGSGGKGKGICKVEDVVRGKSQEYEKLVQETCEGRSCRCRTLVMRRGGKGENKRTTTQDAGAGGSDRKQKESEGGRARGGKAS
jgi:hypothetical protein